MSGSFEEFQATEKSPFLLREAVPKGRDEFLADPVA
jgi:hypothetical protein